MTMEIPSIREKAPPRSDTSEEDCKDTLNDKPGNARTRIDKKKGILIHRDPGALGDGVRVQGPEVDVDLQAQKNLYLAKLKGNKN